MLTLLCCFMSYSHIVQTFGLLAVAAFIGDLILEVLAAVQQIKDHGMNKLYEGSCCSS